MQPRDYDIGCELTYVDYGDYGEQDWRVTVRLVERCEHPTLGTTRVWKIVQREPIETWRNLPRGRARASSRKGRSGGR